MKKLIKSIVILVCVCAVMATLLAIANMITATIIETNNSNAAIEALKQVMPNGEFSSDPLMDTSGFELPSTIKHVYKESNGGYVFELSTTGYKSDLIIMCGVNADQTVSGALCLSSNETLGKEKNYGDNFIGKDADGVNAVDTISGATMTTGAYRSAINDAINAAKILGGENVDIRTEAEILNDNLSAALPSADGKFTKMFLVELVDSIDAIYEADNKTGYVCVLGESFIGVDANANVITETSAEIAENLSTQIIKLNATTIEKLDLSVYSGIHKNIVEVSKTATENYVIVAKGAGYGIKGGDDYHPASGEYIYIKVSMTREGKIIDCLTLSEEETDGIGSLCADEKFYGQFVGKTEDNYKEIDAISKATLTTNGYKTAIGQAFETVKIIEGGAANAE